MCGSHLDGRMPQIMFALKETNGGKLHSHLWFFTAFCEQIQPKYTLVRCRGHNTQGGRGAQHGARAHPSPVRVCSC